MSLGLWGAVGGAGKGMSDYADTSQKDYIEQQKEQRLREWKTGLIKEDREYQAGLLNSANEREDQQLKDNRAHETNIARIRASGSGSSKLNPYIAAQIEGIDNKLKALYESPDNTEETSKLISDLESQRTFLLGGGISRPQPTITKEKQEAPEKKTGGGLLDERGRSANPVNFLRGKFEELHKGFGGEGGSSIPAPEFLQAKKDSVIADLESGKKPDKSMLTQVWPYLSPAEKAKAESL